MSAFSLRRIVASIVLITVSMPSRADSPAQPFSYTKATATGEYIFAMIADDPSLDQFPLIRETYRVSGLYRMDDPLTPLWTVDWYSFEVYPVSDGVHLVCPGPWAMYYDDPAVSFYANGKLVREYKVNQLVTFPRLMPHSMSHFFWTKEEGLNDGAMTYTITTLHLERYVFDVTTGRIVSSFSPFSIVFLTLFGVAASIAIAWKLKRKHKVSGS